MLPISTVIITKNESRNIVACIRSAQLITTDIIVVDCGSVDNTIELAKKAGAKVIVIEWLCYGDSRNTGAAAAKYDWIMAIDADERITPALADAFQRENFSNTHCIYKIRRDNYYHDVKINFGTLGFERIARLYNRNHAQWDLVPVHEKLQSEDCQYKNITQCITHFGIHNKTEHIRKKEYYALLSAHKYFQQGKSATPVKRFLSPTFNGLKSYLFQLGFLDGTKGWQVATTIAYYTWLKYKHLYQLTHKQAKPNEVLFQLNSAYKEATSTFSLKR